MATKDAPDVNRKQKLQMQFLCKNIESEKNTMESFLDEEVPRQLVEQVREVMKHLMERAVDIQKKRGQKTFQERMELKNTDWLCSKFRKINKLQYWHLLQILYKFPNDFQIGVDEFLSQYIRKSPHFKELNKIIHLDVYISNNWSFKRFLTDCIAFARLRRLQLKYMQESKDEKTALERATQIEKEFSVIPDNLILERRLGGNQNIAMFKGMDISKNVPVFIKYLRQDFQEEKGMTLQEAKKRFEREAQAFEKLERHRKAKEQAVQMLLDQAQKQIEEGNQTGNTEKMKSGLALMKQGDKLRCDRYFVKAYCLATGQMERYSLTKMGFVRTDPCQVGFMVMEYVEGVNLRELIDEYKNKNTMFPMKVFIPIMEGILQALEYCHNEGIIHRDIRPENILITKDFKVRLTNLGLAKVEDMTQLTSQGVFIGTPGFASPEGIVQGNQHSAMQLSEMVTATDHRFDLYSLGCVAYEMLAGRPVFTSNKRSEDERNIEILNKHLHESPVPITEYRKDVSEALNLLILKLLAKNPNQRFESAQEVLITLHTVMSLGQKATEYTKKLLDRLRTTEQETVFPKIKQPSAGRWLIVVAVLLLLLTGVLVFHKNIFPFVQRQYGKFFSQRTLDRVQAREMLGTIDKFIVTLKEDWNKNNEVYLTLVNNFSPEEGYPIIVETLVLQHNSSKQRIEDLESTCVRARSHLLSNPKESLDLLTPVLELSKQDSMSLLLKRIFDKLQFTHNLALQIKKTKDEEHFVFKENRNLRNDFFSAEERLSFLEEKLYLFQEEYPAQKNYLGVSPEFNKKLLESKRKIDIAKQSIHALNEAMIENNVPKAKGILQENSKFSSVLDDLDNLEHQLTTLTDSNAKKKANWELQSTYSRGSSYLDTIAQQLQERLVFAKTVRREHAKRKQGLQDPVDLWGRVDIEISRIKEEREKLNNFWAQSKSQEVLAFSQEILKQTEPLVLNDLQKFIENEQEAVKKIEDDLRIKKAASKKQSVQQQQRIADFLSKLRSQYQIVVNAKIQWNKAIEQFQKEFPDKIHTIKNTTLQNELKKLDEWQNKTLQDIENYLNNKQIREAYNIASRQNAKILQLPKYSDSVTKEINKIQITTKNLLQEKENLALQARCERIVQRLETNISLMENQVYPLEKDIQALRYDFQPRSQYPEISKKSLDMVEDSRNWIRHYQSKLQIARNYMQNKQWHDAFEVLKGFEGVRLSGYTTLSSNIQTIQEEIAQTRRKSEQIQLHIARSGEYTKFHQELLQLKNDLSQVITDLRTKKEQLDRFSASEGYQVADPNIPKYLNEGLEEIKELEVVLAKGNEYLESQKYAQATALLKPYSQELHPGTSRILLLKTYLQQCDTKIQKNISLQQDSGARHSILQEQAKKQQELALLQQWRKSPASWYDQMIGDLQQFTSWESLLVKSMQGKGSTMVHSRIQSLIADISSYPDAMAELQDLENKARNIGINQTELARDYRNKAMLDYLHTHQIDPGLASEVSQIQSAVRNIKKELNSYWVEEATLRSLLQALQSLERKFENQHQSIKSRLLVLITN